VFELALELAVLLVFDAGGVAALLAVVLLVVVVVVVVLLEFVGVGEEHAAAMSRSAAIRPPTNSLFFISIFSLSVD
jgi:hypothetical protein